MKVKAICFDADGVVVNPQMQFSRLREEKFGISAQTTRSFFKGKFNDCLIGKADLMTELAPYLKEWNWKGSIEDYLKLWLAADHVIDASLIAKIQKLRAEGFICCLTTNQEHYRAEYMKTEMGFQSLFDQLFISCEMGIKKPDVEYYQYVEKHLKLAGEDILFWDDSLQNVTAARACGWQAEVYSDFEQFLKKLPNYIL